EGAHEHATQSRDATRPHRESRATRRDQDSPFSLLQAQVADLQRRLDEAAAARERDREAHERAQSELRQLALAAQAQAQLAQELHRQTQALLTAGSTTAQDTDEPASDITPAHPPASTHAP